MSCKTASRTVAVLQLIVLDSYITVGALIILGK